MSDPSAAPPLPAEAERPSGFFANLIDLYFAPAEAFANLLRKSAFLTPLLVQLALSIALWGTWLQKADMGEVLTAQMQEAGQVRTIPADRMEQVDRFMRRTYWIVAVAAPPIGALVLAGLFLFIYRFFYASDVTFRQSLAIVTSSFAVYSLVWTPLMLGVLALKNEWNILPPEAFQANLTLLLEKQAAAKTLWAAASGIDLFSFWLIFLLATGYGVAGKRNWSWALLGVVVPWAIWVVGKVFIVFLRS